MTQIQIKKINFKNPQKLYRIKHVIVQIKLLKYLKMNEDITE